jgi:hypothetical protein
MTRTGSVLIANNAVQVTLKQNGHIIARRSDLTEDEAKELVVKWENGTYQLLIENPSSE